MFFVFHFAFFLFFQTFVTNLATRANLAKLCLRHALDSLAGKTPSTFKNQFYTSCDRSRLGMSPCHAFARKADPFSKL
jgi:hypothetical protein